MQVIFENTEFEIDMGRKGARAAWSSTLPVDLADIAPEHRERILRELIGMGLQYHLKQASTKDGITEPEALDAMAARWAKMCAGDMDRKNEVLGPVERRTRDLLAAALQAQARRPDSATRGKPIADADLKALVAKLVEERPEKVAPFRERAEEQIRQERAAAQAAASDLGDLLNA